jgi:isochorismate synthase EntC
LLKLCIFVLQVSTSIVKFPKQAPPTLILSSHNIPSKEDWNLAVNRALQMIEQNDSSLTKVTTSHAFSLLDFESFLELQETI